MLAIFTKIKCIIQNISTNIYTRNITDVRSSPKPDVEVYCTHWWCTLWKMPLSRNLNELESSTMSGNSQIVCVINNRRFEAWLIDCNYVLYIQDTLKNIKITVVKNVWLSTLIEKSVKSSSDLQNCGVAVWSSSTAWFLSKAGLAELGKVWQKAEQVWQRAGQAWLKAEQGGHKAQQVWPSQCRSWEVATDGCWVWRVAAVVAAGRNTLKRERSLFLWLLPSPPVRSHLLVSSWGLTAKTGTEQHVKIAFL